MVGLCCHLRRTGAGVSDGAMDAGGTWGIKQEAEDKDEGNSWSAGCTCMLCHARSDQRCKSREHAISLKSLKSRCWRGVLFVPAHLQSVASWCLAPWVGLQPQGPHGASLTNHYQQQQCAAAVACAAAGCHGIGDVGWLAADVVLSPLTYLEVQRCCQCTLHLCYAVGCSGH